MTTKQELPRAEDSHDIYPLEWLAKAIDSARRVERHHWISEQRQAEAAARLRALPRQSEK